MVQITVKQLREFLTTCPDEAIIKTTDRFDTDGNPVNAESVCMSKDGKSVAIESGWGN